VASISASNEEDRQITIRELATTHGMTFGTVNAILTDDLAS
jgi:hypothetical protein